LVARLPEMAHALTQTQRIATNFCSILDIALLLLLLLLPLLLL
jgi:hypothetical protein